MNMDHIDAIGAKLAGVAGAALSMRYPRGSCPSASDRLLTIIEIVSQINVPNPSWGYDFVTARHE